MTADAALDAMEHRLREVHGRAKEDAAINHLGDIHESVPRYLLDYADRYGKAMKQTRQSIIREAMCLFYAIREIDPDRITAPPKAPKRRVVVSRRRVRVRIPRRAG